MDIAIDLGSDRTRVFIENKGKVLSRNYLLDKIWGYDYYGETRTVDVHIRHLRKWTSAISLV